MLDKEVLRGKKEFSAVYKRGKSVGDRYVVIFFKKNGLPYNRLAFLASKKVGNAVVRNRARRLMKESIRIENPIKKKGYDIIFIARKTICDKKCKDVSLSIHSAIKKSKLN